MAIKKRLFLVLLAIFIVIMGGANGYSLLYGGQYSFVDYMYMTVISLTGVGYGEVVEVTGNVPAQIFTMILITFGMGIIFYGISTLAAFMIEGELSGILREQKMQKRINRLKEHYIVCGGGEAGRPLIAELVKNMKTAVLIEQSEEGIELCKSVLDLLYIKGDATEDHNLIAAGIERAAGILINLPSDKDCLYITMTARMLNKKLRIISRMANPNHEAKLRMAGADGIVSPSAIGALRMASEMIRPTAVDFLDKMLRSHQGTLRVNQISISEKSIVEGKNIGDCGLKEKFDLLLVALEQNAGQMEFNPPPSLILKSGMTLIVMGDIANIERARKVC